MSVWLWWFCFAASIAVGLFGDVAMKRAGQLGFDMRWVVAGFVAYSLTGVGWLVLLRTRSLSSFGALYPVANALGLVVLGAILFGERLTARGYIGVGLGVVALILLAAEK